MPEADGDRPPAIPMAMPLWLGSRRRRTNPRGGTLGYNTSELYPLVNWPSQGVQIASFLLMFKSIVPLCPQL